MSEPAMTREQIEAAVEGMLTFVRTAVHVSTRSH